MPTKTKHITCRIPLPSLDDEAAVIIYNGLCELLDRFDHHYGEQICRYYAQQEHAQTHSPPTNMPDTSSS